MSRRVPVNEVRHTVSKAEGTKLHASNLQLWEGCVDDRLGDSPSIELLSPRRSSSVLSGEYSGRLALGSIGGGSLCKAAIS